MARTDNFQLWDVAGNSYTYYNDLPTIVSKLAEAAGEPIEFDSHLEVQLFTWDHLFKPLPDFLISCSRAVDLLTAVISQASVKECI